MSNVKREVVATQPQQIDKALNDFAGARIAFGRAIRGDRAAEEMYSKLRDLLSSWEDEFVKKVLKEGTA